VPRGEHGIAAERDHADLRVEMETTPEPEKVFHDIERTEPVVAVIHELHARLDDTDILARHDGIDDVEDIRVEVVFGVEDRHDIVRRRAQPDIEPMRLVDRPVVEGEDRDTAGIDQLERTMGLDNRLMVTRLANNEHLHQVFRIVRVEDTPNRPIDDVLLVAGGEQDREAESRRLERRRAPALLKPIGLPPRVHHQVQREERLCQQGEGEHQDRPADQDHHDYASLRLLRGGSSSFALPRRGDEEWISTARGDGASRQVIRALAQ